MTVDKLLTGKDSPIGNQEFNGWRAYFARKAEIEQEANNPKKKDNRRVAQTSDFKKTMGATGPQ